MGIATDVGVREPGAVDGGVRRRRGGPGAWFAGLLLLGVSVVVGCRIADTDALTPVPQLLAFLPWLLAPTALALLLALLTRWRTGLVWGVAALAAVAWFMEPYGKTSDPSGPPLADLRVLTANVLLGQASDALVTAVRRERPDLVFVPECEQRCTEALKVLADDYPYRSAVEKYGSEGSVILGRTPFTATGGIPGTLGMPGAVAEVKGQKIRLQLAHPMPPLPDTVGVWRRELGALRDFAAAEPDIPTIIAGDFNATQDHAAFRRILDTGLRDSSRLAGEARTPTWPSRSARVIGAQIDHVLVSEDFTAHTARFLDLPDTDHRAVLTDLTLHRPR
ncbi:endonuclease/exonuclease/phosphatase family protein [Streptomyces sp. NPDC091292]|uniref:endonuclease/exonuclease/phosphatase family protein n=1 Tax=Streptomyces sp. NPDC091292 TaxID=3365991 RepID=UPI0037FD2C37